MPPPIIKTLECTPLPKESPINLMVYSASEAASSISGKGQLSPFIQFLGRFAPKILKSMLKKRVITYADYQNFVLNAKETQFGISLIEVDGKKIVFFANPSIYEQLVKLETQPENESTKRVVRTNKNHRLLEMNPVAASCAADHSYAKEQREFFSRSAEHYTTILDLIFKQIPFSSKLMFADENAELIAKLFSQLYFQLLFSNPKDADKEAMLARINACYDDIKALYEQVENLTGKHHLSIASLIGNEESADLKEQNEQLLKQFYKVICLIYSEKMEDSLFTPFNEEAVTSTMLELMKKHKAEALTVFPDHFTPSMICFNLLSWVDNSLNIVNTLLNYVISISHEKQDIVIETYFLKKFRDLRALATMFMREVKTPIQLTFGDKTFDLNPGDRFLMTNSIEGCVLGSMPRKCPSRDFSLSVIPEFLTRFFARFKTHALGSDTLDPRSRSWFWNKLDPTELIVAEKDNPIDLENCRRKFLKAFAEKYQEIAGKQVSNQITNRNKAGFFSTHRQGINLVIDILSQKDDVPWQESTLRSFMQRLQALSKTTSHTHEKVSTRALIALKREANQGLDQKIDDLGIFNSIYYGSNP